eukprot:6490620-Amphidinium_carterae.3
MAVTPCIKLKPTLLHYLSDHVVGDITKWETNLVTGDFLLEHDAFSMLALEQAWTMSIFELESCGRPLVALHPGIVSVCLVPGLGDLELWPPKRKPRTKRPIDRTSKASGSGLASATAPLPSAEFESFGNALEDVQSDGCCSEGEQELASNLDLEEIFGIDSLLLRAEALQHLGDDLLQSSGELAQAAADQVGDVAPEDTEQEAPEQTMPLPAGSSVAPPGFVEEDKQPLGCTTEVLASSSLEERTPARAIHTVGTPRGLVGTAACSVVTPHGRISYYAGKCMFEAVCFRHKACKLSRTSNGTKPKNDCIYGGRPLGMMMKWLSLENVSSKSEHWQKDDWLVWSHGDRSACRAELARLPGALELFDCERRLSPGETEEPTTMKGLVR